MGRLWFLPVTAIRPVKHEDWMVVSDKLAAAFGLKLVGKGNRKIPLGFLRIPSAFGQPEYVDRSRNMVRKAILGCARWTFDLSVIRSWGTNASSN